MSKNTRTPTLSSSAEDVTLPPVIRKAMFIAPELLDSMAMANGKRTRGSSMK